MDVAMMVEDWEVVDEVEEDSSFGVDVTPVVADVADVEE